MRAVIIGAGIGGLAVAIALRRVGVDTLNVERAAILREVGAGLSLWLNALHALRELGVEAKVLEMGSVVERSLSQTLAGRLIAISEFSEFTRSAPVACICVHRAALQRILLEKLPPESVRTGSRCVGFEDSAAILEDGTRIEGDVLIGADGIDSVIRDGLHGTAPPRYAGYTCWRGTCRSEKVLPDCSALLAVGAGTQFGLWPCGAGQFYWFLTKNAAPCTPQTKADAVALCRRCAPRIRNMVEGTPEDAMVQNDIFDRPPLAWWGRGCITLLGDAAHATTPNLGQGACQALEDAIVLADCLRRIRLVERALREYERQRIARTTSIVRQCWQIGQVLQLDQPALEALRNGFLRTSVAQHLGMRMFSGLLTYRVPTLQMPT